MGPTDEMITADFGTLFDQSWKSAADYLAHSHEEIDVRFGEGYAKKNPQLVAAFIQAANSDFVSAVNLKVVQAMAARLADSISELADSLRE